MSAAVSITRCVLGLISDVMTSRGRRGSKRAAILLGRRNEAIRRTTLRGPRMMRTPAPTSRTTIAATTPSSILCLGYAGRRRLGGGMTSGAKNVTQVAVITGASSGIGAATAIALGRHGYQVVVGARRVERLERVAGEEGVALPLDVTDGRSIEDFVREVGKRFGRIDLLVNNAGGAVGLN